MLLIDYIALIAIGIGMWYTLTGVSLLAYERLRARKPIHPKSLPPISILKPLKGVDDDLEGNLRTFFTIDYPVYEIIFAINDLDDPAIAIVKSLRNQYPEIPTRLVVDEHREGLNPKVNNLVNGCRQARHDYFVISDSNVRVRPDYLRHLIARLQKPNVGLVTSTVRGGGAESLGAVLENLHLNTYITEAVFVVNRVFRVPVTIGKSMCFKRETLEHLGGFEAFVNYLFEDALIGKGIKKLGLKISTSNYWVDNINRTWEVHRFFNRHLRWATMRRHLNIFHYCTEILGNPIVLSLLYLAWRRDHFALSIFVAVLLIKVAADTIAAELLKSDLKWRQYLWIPFKEILMGILWVLPFFIHTVTWRGNKFVIGKNTELIPHEDGVPDADWKSS